MNQKKLMLSMSHLISSFCALLEVFNQCEPSTIKVSILNVEWKMRLLYWRRKKKHDKKKKKKWKYSPGTPWCLARLQQSEVCMCNAVNLLTLKICFMLSTMRFTVSLRYHILMQILIKRYNNNNKKRAWFVEVKCIVLG